MEEFKRNLKKMMKECYDEIKETIDDNEKINIDENASLSDIIARDEDGVLEAAKKSMDDSYNKTLEKQELKIFKEEVVENVLETLKINVPAFIDIYNNDGELSQFFYSYFKDKIDTMNEGGGKRKKRKSKKGKSKKSKSKKKRSKTRRKKKRY